MTRSESERQFYLGMAGIRMWYAREPLPGAAPSPEFDFGVAPAGKAERMVSIAPGPRPAAPPESTADVGKKDKLARLKTLMDTVPDKPTASARHQSPKPVEVPAAVTSSKVGSDVQATEDSEPGVPHGNALTQVPRLCLQSWSGSRVLLLANLSEEASLSLQETLAMNIVRCLGDSSASELGILRWPLFNNVKVSLNSEADLTALVRDYLAAVSGKVVITLGLSAELSVITDILADVLEKAPDVVFEQSLAALAADPVLKGQLWQLIKPLAVKGR
ncbi:hypothetical protein [Marinobacter halophilus]|uniref:2-isopropylmalate synthase n=1 Tax=Marinobacter halophilus TaxID=1323740 RepID=A0A2T1KAX0_9GAMM|nr:hypothetical protein [Marinobacter halophilus]PSF07274.1 hypothetical protein C7H08_12440 [Marinobacter halophilus]